ncbi:cupredoxin domain-containing protein [Mucilaginibacter sp. BJC16-A38]|uniref:plastocyanin/azurin family copper-binding protein n=1 Tax=Mucilaginibacter phenanthrenivorans TaxID=1234842 RepID=UPI0021570713|nr:plastocyanin/azurin family copper-binding protein [Mucilaginibacter phenanthrenivorans]MCR8557151.1 cupredoxin domain-containing protein [Mucilaginibacter phenanthrenivorans]
MKKKLIYLSFIVLAGLSLTYSCSSNKAKVNPTPSTPSATVAISNFAFVPDTVRIKSGQSVTWTNMDSAPHTATDLNGAFDSGTLATNKTFNFTFNATGTFSYHCLVHSMMKTAVVIVTN